MAKLAKQMTMIWQMEKKEENVMKDKDLVISISIKSVEVMRLRKPSREKAVSVSF